MRKLFVSVLICWALGLASGTAVASGPDWDDFLAKMDDNLFRGALAVADSIAAESEADGDAEEWTKALVESVRLQWSLGAHESAAEHLLKNPGPQDPPWRDILALYRAHALQEYVERYDYHIRDKPTVTRLDSLDVSTWSLDRLAHRIQSELTGVWLGRDTWADRGLDDLSAFIDQNTYPARIRGTLRDAVSYLLAESLANSTLWSPRQSNGLFRLDVETLMDGDAPLPQDAWLVETGHHPLERLHLVLADLRQWHLAGGRTEAAHEAQLELLRHLRNTLTHSVDHQRLLRKLETVQADLDPALPWWAFGQWRLAKFINREDLPDSPVRARFAAVKGARRHPESPGGRLCDRLAAEIDLPDLSVSAMGQDLPGRRSILITHRNLKQVHLRAWRVEPDSLFPNAHLLDRPHTRVTPERVADTEPDLAWTVVLPVTEDYDLHRTYTSLPDCPPGSYLIAVSARSDFKEEENVLAALSILVSDLVLQARQLDDVWEVQAVSGTTGRAWPNVELEVVPRNNRDSVKPLTTLRTDAQGLATFSVPLETSCAVVARAGDHEAGLDYLGRNHYRAPRRSTQAFLYTDRSVYRPGQTVYWKAVQYTRDPGETDYRTLPESAIDVTLQDPNREELGRFEGKTNGFGSASGQFVLPASGVLGGWVLEVPGMERLYIQVEEYKRPTFEVELDDMTGEPELNRPVRLTGRAGFYFGQPVTEGRVTWRVERTPVFKRWGRRYGPMTEVEVIATGETELNTDGTFALIFTPETDRRIGTEDGVSYRYTVEVDVTNAGGETRSGGRTYRLGFTGVEGMISPARQLYLSDGTADFTVRRKTLDGAPRPGAGTWQVAALVQPDVAPLPADLPADTFGKLTPTPGDSLRPRWEVHGFGAALLAQWPVGRIAARGDVVHDETGTAAVSVEGLAPGAYRLIYETVDERGRSARAERDFIVAGRDRTPLALPLVVLSESPRVQVGDTARILVHSGLIGQDLRLEIFKGRRRVRDAILRAGETTGLLEIPVTEDLRGGFSVVAACVRDHQRLSTGTPIVVPWNNKDLTVEFLSFRDRLIPGADTDFKVKVTGPDAQAVDAGTVEVLAYMYDRTLDLFADHNPAVPRGLFRQNLANPRSQNSLGRSRRIHIPHKGFRLALEHGPRLLPDRIPWAVDLYVRGGRDDALLSLNMPVARTMEVEGAAYMVEVKSSVTEHTVTSSKLEKFAVDSLDDALNMAAGTGAGSETEPPAPNPGHVRENFAPTAFFAPHVTLGDDGTAVIAFKVPDSVTDWNVWAHAFTRELDSGSAHRTVSSRQDLMVRPYLPRFLREGDAAVVQVLVDNAGETDLSGTVHLSLSDPVTGADVSADFGLRNPADLDVAFAAAAGAGQAVTFSLAAPMQPGSVVVKVVARAGHLSDGEQHELPILPGRLHLAQSRFVTLDDVDRRDLVFPDMAADDDATLVHDQLVVTVDAQLFQGVLAALPYLVDYPYECTEQTLNRFLSTAIIQTVFEESPALASMAKALSERESRLPAWQVDDPNRKMQLEETPWLVQSRGGGEDPDRLINLLDPDIAADQMRGSSEKLRNMQTQEGGFPWMPGGRPSPYLTLYVLQGLSRAREFGVEIDDEMATQAWRFMHRYYVSESGGGRGTADLGWRQVTFLNYLLSGLSAEALDSTGFTPDDRQVMLDYSFLHWKAHSRLLKGQLALTLARAGRLDDARRVTAAAMDAARTEQDRGTFWAPEERSWLWYNDTVEAHAFMLRVLTEIAPDDDRRHGLVKWLFLNRHLGHWKSTRATAEVIYALTHYLRQEGTLGAAERITLDLGGQTHTLVFDPAVYTGQDNHIVVAGEDIDAGTMSTVTVAKDTPGMSFASATWHFSTDRMPDRAEGDLLTVTRRHYRRFQADGRWQLELLEDGAGLQVGDQVEVYLDVTAGHAAEYVHLRDPRGAGFEPEDLTSGYRWGVGTPHYREIRDSGTNIFFDRLPAGTYALKYRLRATMAGTFRVGPAVLQSMYAPEFTAYSAGKVLEVGP